MQNHIRKSIEKFVDNRRIQILKYKYLKKVQDARIESVRMALRKMQAMRNMKIQSKGNLFEKGLSSFVNRVLRASFESFRDDYERAQNLKKAAVVQMMNTTMSSRKKMYNRWRVLTEKTKLI
jgi:hypothetical protein